MKRPEIIFQGGLYTISLVVALSLFLVSGTVYSQPIDVPSMPEDHFAWHPTYAQVGIGLCQQCHGGDLRGSDLSRTSGFRVFPTKDEVID